MCAHSLSARLLFATTLRLSIRISVEVLVCGFSSILHLRCLIAIVVHQRSEVRRRLVTTVVRSLKQKKFEISQQRALMRRRGGAYKAAKSASELSSSPASQKPVRTSDNFL